VYVILLYMQLKLDLRA